MSPGRRRRRLVERRESLGLTQEKLAELVGVDRTTVARWELGVTAPQPARRLLLAKVLNVSPKELSMLIFDGRDGARSLSASRRILEPVLDEESEDSSGDLHPSIFGQIQEYSNHLFTTVPNPRQVNSQTIASIAKILAEQRRLEDAVGSAPLLVSVTAQMVAITKFVKEARGSLRRQLIDVSGQYAQFAGWLYANSRRPVESQYWFDRALEWASESGNESLYANVLGFKGHLAWQGNDWRSLVALSEAAQHVPDAHPGERAFSAYQQARGHAMAGDSNAAERKLHEAVALWAYAAEYKQEPSPPWSYYYSPAFSTLQSGLVNRYLGRTDIRRARHAAELFMEGLSGLPEEVRHAEWVGEYVYQLALANIDSSEPELACKAAIYLHRISSATGSAKVRERVRRLHVTITQRWPTLPAAIDLTERTKAGFADPPS